MRLIRIVILGTALSVSACNKGKSDKNDEADDTQLDSENNSSISASGPLAAAFPSKLNIGSAFVSSGGTSLRLTDENDYDSVSEKAEILSEIFAAGSIDDCFQKMSEQTFEQPACFAPSLQRSKWESDKKSYNVKLADNVNQLLYGDGGMVKATEGGESCTASTINYFLESAIGTIDMGRQIFATLVCASKFKDSSLPEDGQTKDFIDVIRSHLINTAS